MSEDLWLVVGLGNPGPGYAGNRHNVGAMVVSELADRLGGTPSVQKRLRADVLTGRLGGPGGNRVAVAVPRAFMNESGGPVAALREFYKVGPERIVVIHDELDLPFGTLRLKTGGGDNGHNGLRSIRSSIGSGEFHRVRVGIGRPPGRQDPADYVLKDFAGAERKDLGWFLDRAADATTVLLQDGLVAAQNTYNE